MELWKLSYFVAVAEELHFSRAARRLNITQPGLSQQIKTMERDLGVELFERSRGVRLTPAGQVLLTEARLLLEHAAQIEATVRLAATGVTGTLRVVYNRSIDPRRTYALIDGFRHCHQGVRIHTDSGGTAHSLDMLASGLADVAFVQLPLPDGCVLASVVVGQEELAVALSAEHRLAAQPAVEREALRTLRMLVFPRTAGPGHYDSILRQVWGSVEPRLAEDEFADAEQMLVAVGLGKGFAVIERNRGAALRPPGVRILPFVGPAPTLTYGLAWNPTALSITAERFITYCRSRARESDAGEERRPASDRAEPGTA